MLFLIYAKLQEDNKYKRVHVNPKAHPVVFYFAFALLRLRILKKYNKISKALVPDFDWLVFNGHFPSYTPNSCSLSLFCSVSLFCSWSDSHHRSTYCVLDFLEFAFPSQSFDLFLFGVMVGALFVVGSSVMDSCLCKDAHTRSKKKILGSARKLELGSSFAGSGIVFRLSSKRVPRIANRRSKRKLLIVSEDVAGNYDDTFGDVKTVRMIVSERSQNVYVSDFSCFAATY